MLGDPLDPTVSAEREAYGYLSRLFKLVAPQCEPLPTLIGLCTQIDNAFVYVREQARESLLARLRDPDVMDAVAQAICQSRTCEGINCCQFPANRGRTNCPVERGGYDDAATAALKALAAKLVEAK